MRVMLVAPLTNIHSQRFLDWLHRLGCDVICVGEAPPPNLGERDKFYEFPKGFSKWAQTNLRRWSLFVGRTLINKRRLRAIWKQEKPDIVHVHSIDTNAFAVTDADLKPRVLTSWGSDVNQHFTFATGERRRRRTGRTLATADFVFADSQELLDRCNQLAGRPLHSQLLRLGIDTQRFRPGYNAEARKWRAELQIPEGAKVLLSMRALRPEHRHLDMLHALQRISPSVMQRTGQPTYLILKRYNPYPDVDVYEKSLKAEIAKLGLNDSVRWLGHLEYEQVPAIYAASDVIVNYLRADGFPVTFLEAAACGKAVVSSRLPAYADEDLEKCFRFVDPEDPAAFDSALIEALTESIEESGSRGMRAREWAMRHGDQDACAAAVMKVYQSILSGS